MEKPAYGGVLRTTLLTKYYSVDQIKKNEMGHVGLTARGQEHKGFRWKT
jgi:hypothetical protein